MMLLCDDLTDKHSGDQHLNQGRCLEVKERELQRPGVPSGPPWAGMVLLELWWAMSLWSQKLELPAQRGVLKHMKYGERLSDVLAAPFPHRNWYL